MTLSGAERGGARAARAAAAGTAPAGASDRRMPRRPRNGLVSPSRRQAGDRLVAAGVERADDDRAGRAPTRAIRAIGRDTASSSSGRRGAELNRNSVRTRPMPSHAPESTRRRSSGVGDVDHDARPARRRRVTAGRATRRGLARPALGARRPSAARIGEPARRLGLEHERALRRRRAWPRRRRRRPSPRPTTIGTPRARASMATWLEGLPRVERDAAAARPVEREEARRRQVLGEHDGARRQRRLRPRVAARARGSTRSRRSARSAARARK